MSGTRAIVLNLSVKDAEVVRTQLEAMGASGENALKRLDAAAKAAAGTGGAGGGGLAAVRGQVGNLGFQVQDAAVQIQSGTNALTVLAQQGSQFLGGFGPAGAAAGAVLAIGAVAAQLGLAAINGRDLEKVLKDVDASSKLAEDAARRRTEGLDTEASRINALAEAYRAMSSQALAGEAARISQQREELGKSGRSAVRDVIGRAGFGSTLFDTEQGSITEASPVEASAMADLRSLNDLSTITRERLLEVAGALDVAARAGGPFADVLKAARDRIFEGLGPLTEIGDKSRQLAADQERVTATSGAAATGIAGVGSSAGGAAVGLDAASGAAGRLSAKLSDLQAQAAQRLSAPAEAIANTQQLLSALDTGGTRAVEALQRTQLAAGTLDDRVRAGLAAQDADTRKLAEAEVALAAAQGRRGEGVLTIAGIEARIASDRVEREDRLRASLRELDQSQETLRQRTDARRRVEQEAEAAASRARSASRAAESKAERDAARDAREAGMVREDTDFDGNAFTRDSTVLATLDRLRKARTDREEREAEKTRNKAEREAEALAKAELDGQRSLTRLSERFGDTVADDIARGIVEGGRNGSDTLGDTLSRTLRSVVTRSVSEGLNATLLQPGAKAALSALGIQGGAILDQNGRPVLDQSGRPQSGLVNSSGQALDIGSLRNIFTGGSVSTGIGGLDRTLNTQLFEGVGGQNVNVGNALAGAGYGLNAYQGFKRGGTGGTIQGIGSTIAAASLLTPAAPFAPLIAAGSSILGGLFGGKKGFSGGTIQVEVDDKGQLAVAGSRGKGGANPAEATAALAQQLATLNTALTERGIKLANNGGTVAEQGYGQDGRVADIASVVRAQAQADSEAVRTVLRNSAASTVDGLLKDIDFGRAFEGLTGAADTVDAFTKALLASRKSFADAEPDTTRLGLSLDALRGAAAKAETAMLAQREATLTGYLGTDADRQRTARGETASLGEQLVTFDRAAIAEIGAYYTELRTKLGLTEGESQQFTDSRQATFAAERTRIVRDAEATAQQAAQAAADAAARVANENIATIARNISVANGYQDRIDAANGFGATLAGRLAKLDRDSAAEREAAVREGGVAVGLLDTALAESRLSIIRDFNAQAADLDKQRADQGLATQRDALSTQRDVLSRIQGQQSGLLTFLNDPSAGGAVSPQNAFLAAQEAFRRETDALRQAGTGADVSAFTTAGQTLRTATTGFFGAGSEAAAVLAGINSTARNVGAQFDLPAFGGTLDRAYERANVPIVDELKGLRDDVDRLSRALTTASLMAA